MLTISDFDPKEVNKLAEIGTKLTEAEEKGECKALSVSPRMMPRRVRESLKTR